MVMSNQEQAYRGIAKFIQSKAPVDRKPRVGIICGSGLSNLSSCLEDVFFIPFKDIPLFPSTTVPGHAGEIVFGRIGEVQCICMRGRAHYYEGSPMSTVVLAVRVMCILGVKLLIVTNAAGGLNAAYNVGDVMIMADHIGLPTMSGCCPLIGDNDDSLGPRFPSMMNAYHPALQQMVRSAAETLHVGNKIRSDGCYVFVSGPCYETTAEARLLRTIGADAVGASTVPEVIAARQCGMLVLGLSLITNKVVTASPAPKPGSHGVAIAGTDDRNLTLISTTTTTGTAADNNRAEEHNSSEVSAHSLSDQIGADSSSGVMQHASHAEVLQAVTDSGMLMQQLVQQVVIQLPQHAFARDTVLVDAIDNDHHICFRSCSKPSTGQVFAFIAVAVMVISQSVE